MTLVSDSNSALSIPYPDSHGQATNHRHLQPPPQTDKKTRTGSPADTCRHRHGEQAGKAVGQSEPVMDGGLSESVMAFFQRMVRPQDE
jgi:hypothetical protein